MSPSSPDFDQLERLDLASVIVERVHGIFGEPEARVLWKALDLPDLWPSERQTDAPMLRTNMPAARRGVGDFLEQMCERHADAETRAFVLHSAYQQWALKLGRPVLSPAIIGKILPAFGLTRRNARGTVYRGVRLRPRQPAKARRARP